MDDLNPDLHTWRGVLSAKLHRLDEEGAHYKRAMFLNREHAEAQFLHARLTARSVPKPVALRQLRIAKSVLAKRGGNRLKIPGEQLSGEEAVQVLDQIELELKG